MATALILSAGSDIARSIAMALAKDGYDLQLAGRNMDQLLREAKDLEIRSGKTVSVYEWDALNFDSHPGFYASLKQRPDLVVCVTGYLGDQKIAEDNRAEMLKILNTNYTGCVSILEEAAREMEQKKSGGIIGISSVAGERGRASNYFYGSAKAGFTAYLSGLRNRLFFSGVHVLTVKPGFVKTKMTEGLPLNPKLTATPDQVAADILKAWKKKKNSIFTLWFWKWIMAIITFIPEGKFKSMKL